MRAYRVQTGALAWQDQFDYAHGDNDAVDLVAQADRVFAGGLAVGPAGLPLWILRAYTK